MLTDAEIDQWCESIVTKFTMDLQNAPVIRDKCIASFQSLCSQAKEANRLVADAGRYRYLRELPRNLAQAFFWTFESRKQRDEAIDAARVQDKGKA